MNRGLKLLLIMILVAVTIGGGLAYADSKREPVKRVEVTEATPLPQPHILAVADIDIEQLYKLVNGDRVTAGLSPLLRDPLLDSSAQDKCNDMVARDYWAHKAPDGLTHGQIIGKYEGYFKEGENLEYGGGTAQSVEQGWMGSASHKQNILDTEFTNVGYAVCLSPNYQNKGKNLIVVQHLIKP